MINGNRTKSNRGRSPRDFYITPPELAYEATRVLIKDERLSLTGHMCLDAGCGTGVWGTALRTQVQCYIHGVDIRSKVSVENKDSYSVIYEGDYLDNKPDSVKYDLIYGNPPYSLAEEFIRHSFDLLKEDGRLFFLLRLSFLEGIKRCRGLFKDWPLKRVYVCSRRPSFFSTNGKKHTTDTLAYAMFLWQKNCFDMGTDLAFLDWDYE